MDTSAPTLNYPGPTCGTLLRHSCPSPPCSHSHYGAFSAYQVHAKQTVSALGELTGAWEAFDK